MKLKHLLLIPLLSLSAMAGTVPVAWDDTNTDTDHYTFYQKLTSATGVVSWVKIKDTPVTSGTISTIITSKEITVTVTCWNKIGLESLRSNELLIPAPKAATNLRTP